jgi:RNA polymerase sigma-70 factor (ECF subfamily)
VTDQYINNQDLSDIKASQAGDHQAYRRLVERYQAEVSRLMWRFCQSELICEELVQDVFIEAYYSLKSYKQRAPFIYWLKRIATRVGYRFWKRQARQRQFKPMEMTREIAASAQEADAREMQTMAHRLLDRLSPEDRLVLTLLYFDQCSTETIARRLGWTHAMVKMRAYRARKRLRTIVDQEGLLEDFPWTP